MQITPRFGILIIDKPALEALVGEPGAKDIDDAFTTFDRNGFFKNLPKELGRLDVSVGATQDSFTVDFLKDQTIDPASSLRFPKTMSAVELLAQTLRTFIELGDEITSAFLRRQMLQGRRENASRVV